MWKNCGSKHLEGHCPALSRRCNNCRKLNHYAKVCRSGRNISIVQQVETGDDHFYLESITASLDSLDSRNRKSREKSSEYVTLLIVEPEISLKLYTGAEVNVIPYATFKKIAGASKIMLRKPKANLTAYNGQDIPVTAVCYLSCKHKYVTYDLEFYITSMKSEPGLSVSACRELKFVNNLKEETADQFSARIQSEYKDVFEELGCLERPYHIELQPHALPLVSLPR